MFSDPQTVTIATVAHALPRIKSEGLSGTYQANDQSVTLKIAHTPSGVRIRSMVRTDQRALKTDPVTGVTDWQTLSVYTVIERPITGFSLTEVTDLVAGHASYITGGTTIAKLYGSES
jgi:hypothetical protein